VVKITKLINKGIFAGPMDTFQQVIGRLPPLESLLCEHEGLPHPFIPASDSYFQEQFYWDSFFIMQGLKHLGTKGQAVMKGMVENFFAMLEEYGYIPNSYITHDTRTQPPFLSSMVRMVHAASGNGVDSEWLEMAYGKIVQEYMDVWTTGKRLTSTGLSRYHDDNDPHNKGGDPSYGAMQESGWDNTLRFGGSVSSNGRYVERSRVPVCNPVDLNSLLYKYEADLAVLADDLGRRPEAARWRGVAAKRKEIITKYLWDEEQGFFFDYDPEADKALTTLSLAGYYPLWAGLATEEQAKLMVEKLPVFEYDGGLSATEKKLSGPNIQWGYPNGWAPLHWLVVNGLRGYGFDQDADRITKKWLTTCADAVVRSGQWAEKLCVDPHAIRVDDARYEHQANLYWTMGVFLDLCQIMEDIIIA